MRSELLLWSLKFFPKSALSSVAGKAAGLRVSPALHQAAIRAFVAAFGVDVAEAAQELASFGTFADFFGRKLRAGSRPVEGEESAVASPVDGVVSEAGVVERGRCVQAKGIDFELGALLGSAELATFFEGGAFATIYLSPRDYHRIHAPLGGEILGYTYLPGELWPVLPWVVRKKEDLYCINERLVTHLATRWGRAAIVKVGATCVGRVRALYDEITTHAGRGRQERTYERPLAVARGDEIGVFEVGSTVILVFEKGRVAWEPWVMPGAPVRVGRKLGVAS